MAGETPPIFLLVGVVLEVKLIKMYRDEDKRYANVHPDMVGEWEKGGYRIVEEQEERKPRKKRSDAQQDNG